MDEKKAQTRKEVFFNSGIEFSDMTTGKEYEIEELEFPKSYGSRLLYKLKNDVDKTVFIDAVHFSLEPKPLLYESKIDRWVTDEDENFLFEEGSDTYKRLWEVPNIREIFWAKVAKGEIPQPNPKVTFADFSIDAGRMDPKSAMDEWNRVLALAGVRSLEIRDAVLADAKRNIKNLVQTAQWMKNSIDSLDDHYNRSKGVK